MLKCEVFKCVFQSLSLNGRHGCALCDIELRGLCSIYYQDNSIMFQNICHHCNVKSREPLPPLIPQGSNAQADAQADLYFKNKEVQTSGIIK